jgi:hypothetical protein
MTVLLGIADAATFAVPAGIQFMEMGDILKR